MFVLDAVLTNMIGYELNPLLESLLGWKLVLIKILFLPLFSVLFVFKDRLVCKCGTVLIFGVYLSIVSSEIYYLFIWSPN